MTALLLVGCFLLPPEPPPPDSEVWTPDSEDTGQRPASGLVVYEGRGTLLDGVYTGEEAWLVEHEADSRVLCRIQYTLTSVADGGCEACDWSVEARISSASIADEDSPDCADLSMDPAAIEGGTVHRGYQSEYLGHGDVLMVLDDDRWTAAAFADFEPETGDFQYRWEYGYRGL